MVYWKLNKMWRAGCQIHGKSMMSFIFSLLVLGPNKDTQFNIYKAWGAEPKIQQKGTFRTEDMNKTTISPLKQHPRTRYLPPLETSPPTRCCLRSQLRDCRPKETGLHTKSLPRWARTLSCGLAIFEKHTAWSWYDSTQNSVYSTHTHIDHTYNVFLKFECIYPTYTYSQ